MFQLIKRVFNLFGLSINRAILKDQQLEKYKKLYPPDSISYKRFYNVGAGGFSHPYWMNVDNNRLNANESNFLFYDLFSLEKLPLENNIAELIYTSHCIEHVNDLAVKNLFKEAYRVLKPGGYFRIVTPDIDLAYDAYVNNDRGYFYWIDDYSSPEKVKQSDIRKPLNEETLAQIFLEDFAATVSESANEGSEKRISDAELKRFFSEMEYEKALDYIVSFCPLEIHKKYPFKHMNWMNENKVRRLLTEAGFNMVYRSGYGQSHSSVLRNTDLFDSSLPKISLYMEARK